MYGNVIEPIGRDYLYSELVNPIFTKDGDNVKVKVAVKFLDNQTSRIVRDRFQKLCEENDYEVVVFHSLRHLSTGYKLKMTNGDVKSVQGDTGHAEAEMVTDVYSEIIDEDRRFNAQKMDKEFYSTLNDDTDNPKQDTDLTDSDMALLELIKSLSPEMKEQFLKQALQR